MLLLLSNINSKLQEIYQMIAPGGHAKLELVNSSDPFAGIKFIVEKSWMNISQLSSGEKTLSSLALDFALRHFKPTPLYVMDEIVASLDSQNVSILANYIKDGFRNVQFLIISEEMHQLADHLVGIYKTDNCTKSVTINPHLLEEAIQPSPAKTVSRSVSCLSQSVSVCHSLSLGESNHTMEMV